MTNTKRIGDIVLSTTNRDPRTKPDDDFVYIDISGVDGIQGTIKKVKRLVGSDAPSRARKIVLKDDIIVSTVRPNLNATAMIPAKYNDEICSTGFAVLRPDGKKVVPKYLYFITRTKQFVSELVQKAKGANYPAVSVTDILDFEFSVPSLETQKQIVAIIEQAEKLKEKRVLTNQDTRAIIQSLFYEMFGDPVKNDKDWTTGALSNCVDNFIVPQRDKPKVFDGDVPWCRIEDFDGIYLSKSKSGKSVSEKTIAEMNLKVYPVGTVIVSCSANLGRCAIIEKPLVTNQTFIGLVPSKQVNSIFLYQYMILLEKKLNNMATGITIKYLGKKHFENLVVIMPPLEVQEEFAMRVKAIKSARAKQQSSTEQISTLFDNLMQKAFKGELVA